MQQHAQRHAQNQLHCEGGDVKDGAELEAVPELLVRQQGLVIAQANEREGLSDLVILQAHPEGVAERKHHHENDKEYGRPHEPVQ